MQEVSGWIGVTAELMSLEFLQEVSEWTGVIPQLVGVGLLQEVFNRIKVTVEPQVRLKLVDRDLLTCLVPALLPSEPHLDPIQRTKIEEEVVNFVAAQIAAMPSVLRIFYQIALHGFNWLAVIRYGGRYTQLAVDRQRRYILSWSHSRIRMIRDFVKLMRSCALLYYLDHPLVMAQWESDQVGDGLDK